VSQITRGWLAFAAIGAGLIHLALVLGAPPTLGIPLGLLGAAEFAWGVLTLSRDRVLLPRVARIVAIAPVLLWSLLVVAGTVLGTIDLAWGVPLLPLAIATGFELFIAAYLSLLLRHEGQPPAPPASSGKYLIGLFAGALVVGALTTPALAMTQAGTPSGGPGFEIVDHGH